MEFLMGTPPRKLVRNGRRFHLPTRRIIKKHIRGGGRGGVEKNPKKFRSKRCQGEILGGAEEGKCTKNSPKKKRRGNKTKKKRRGDGYTFVGDLLQILGKKVWGGFIKGSGAVPPTCLGTEN